MNLDKKDIINLANLAKLTLTEEEISTYQNQLSDVLTYVDKINELDLEKIKESLTGAEDNDVAPRFDEAVDSDPDIINQACEINNSYVSTPQAIKKK